MTEQRTKPETAPQSQYEHAVRRVRFLRVTAEPRSEQIRVAKLYERNIGVDWQKLVAEADKPGDI